MEEKFALGDKRAADRETEDNREVEILTKVIFDCSPPFFGFLINIVSGPNYETCS